MTLREWCREWWDGAAPGWTPRDAADVRGTSSTAGSSPTPGGPAPGTSGRARVSRWRRDGRRRRRPADAGEQGGACALRRPRGRRRRREAPGEPRVVWLRALKVAISRPRALTPEQVEGDPRRDPEPSPTGSSSGSSPTPGSAPAKPSP